MVVRAAGTAIGIGTRASAGTRTGLAFGQLLLSLELFSKRLDGIVSVLTKLLTVLDLCSAHR